MTGTPWHVEPAEPPAWPPQPPVPDEPPDEPTDGPPGPPARPRARRAVVALSVLLGLVLVAGAGVAVYLVRVNAAWQQHSDEWQALAEQHGAELAQTRSDLELTRTELQAVQDQLATAQDRITQLADEKARLGDDSAVQQQLVDYQARVSAAAGQVATALATCIDGQEALIGYLQDTENTYDPKSLDEYRQDVQEFCGQARDANAALQAELAE